MYCAIDKVRDVLDRRHEPYTPQVYPDSQVANAISLAGHIIDAYCGRHFRDEPYVEEVRAAMHPSYVEPVFMTRRPIREIISLIDVNGDSVSYTQRGARVVLVATTAPLTITYTSNDPVNLVPDPVQSACAELAANILANVGEELVSVGTPGAMALANSGPYLTDSLRRLLSPYVQKWGAI